MLFIFIIVKVPLFTNGQKISFSCSVRVYRECVLYHSIFNLSFGTTIPGTLLFMVLFQI